MKYECGTEVMLGDEIMVAYGHERQSLARVVAIGLDIVSNEIEQDYYSWVKSEGMINKESVIVEWIETNPLSHNDPKYAPVGNYMILDCLCCETFIRRGDKPAYR